MKNFLVYIHLIQYSDLIGHLYFYLLNLTTLCNVHYLETILLNQNRYNSKANQGVHWA